MGIRAFACVSALALWPSAGGAETPFLLRSWSDLSLHGLVVQAPEGAAACRAVRFGVWQGQRLVGRTPTLGPGDLAVVRLGRGFGPGNHLLAIRSMGCLAAPVRPRRISLSTPWPDHGWRASVALSAAPAS